MNRDNDSVREHFQKTNDNSGPRIFLALQGGGSHGAFTAGVIQALSDAGILSNVKGISGVSAGAFNAAPLSYALNIGNPDLAPALINKAWTSVASTGRSIKFFNTLTSPFAMFLGGGARYPNLPQHHVDHAHGFIQMAQIMGMQSQAEDIKSRIASVIPDWDVIKNGDIETVIGATKVSTHKGKTTMQRAYFSNDEIDADAVAASATLIGTHRKGGAEYVDGGYTSNPPFEPFLDGDYTDVIAIMLSERPQSLTPLRQRDQINGESFLHDEVFNELAWMHKNSSKHIHTIEMHHEPHWDETSKMNADPRWISELHSRGYLAGADWVKQHQHKLGVRSSFNPQITAPAAELALDKIA